MEYMHRDEPTEYEALQDEIEIQDAGEVQALQADGCGTAAVLQPAPPTPEPLAVLAAAAPSDVPDPRPVTHWGTHKGIIRGGSVCDREGVRRNVHRWNAALEDFTDLKIPADVSREHLSIAFSIKDLKGNDLIAQRRTIFMSGASRIRNVSVCHFVFIITCSLANTCWRQRSKIDSTATSTIANTLKARIIFHRFAMHACLASTSRPLKKNQHLLNDRRHDHQRRNVLGPPLCH